MPPFENANRPLNMPALEALEGMTGLSVPDDIRETILAAPLDDDLSGLRILGDRFESEADAWNGTLQPKKDIAQYVEENGILVPRHFGTLDAALHFVRSGGTIIARSEHPQEYSDFSGLLRSYIVDSGSIENKENSLSHGIAEGLDEDQILFLLRIEGTKTLPMQRYLSVTSQGKAAFSRDISFSYHEYIPGRNVTVVADDAIDGRYHVTSYGPNGRGGAVGGIFNLSGAPFNYTDDLIDTMSQTASPSQIAELIATYDAVRKLPKFSERQCPIMELQLSDDGKIWFLQYHKSRVSRPTQERLNSDEYPPDEGWFRAQAVRGALGSFVTLRTALWYPDPVRHHYDGAKFITNKPEEGSFDHHHDDGFSEAVTSHRIAFFSAQGGRRQYQGMADGNHALRSRWFRPFSSLALGRQDEELMLPEELTDLLLRSVDREGVMGRFALDVAADGLTGYVRLNPDSEQPVFGSAL